MEWINRIFRRKQKSTSAARQEAISPAQAGTMLHMIQNTQITELSCDEVQRVLDQYAEMMLRGEDAVGLLPLVHHHLDQCPDCREEYEGLMQILQAQQK